MLKITVRGGAELRRSFDRLERAVKDEALDVAVAAGAQLIANAAQVNAPYKTGMLRRSLRAERSK